MKNSILFLLLTLSLAFSFISCSDDDKNDDPSLSYDYLCFTAQEAGSTVGIMEIIYDVEKDPERTMVDDTITSGPISQDLEYSSDKKEWKKFKAETVVTLQSVGDKVYFRGNNPDGFNFTSTDENGNWSKYILTLFTMTGKIAASGNIMTLIDRTGETKTIPKKSDGCFMLLFSDCTSLVAAPKLPATELEEHCYCEMFAHCASLREAPELPATELAPFCYSRMFYGCSALAKAPKLPATKMEERCYQAMFNRCKSLKETPELPATELAGYCYCWMFAYCSSLIKVPEQLPATELKEGCYNGMFGGCTSLEKAPVLPAKTLAKLCYYYLFYQCNNLKYVKALFEMTDDELSQPEEAYGLPMYTGGWLEEAAKEGTFVKSKNATWTLRGEHGVPDGWKIETE